ncbi:MAG: TIGR01212 family radical SAM protein [Lachnospiraceae bacterium]|nr:TIGR01212 family radical SAM protein [Lachnospiraceae bacterium]
MEIYTFNAYLKERFGKKIYKISLNAGMSCPNRDGTIGTGGCIFCSEGGSGDFASPASLSITRQIEEGISLVKNKIKEGSGQCYIAYFQAYTNTYAPIERLRAIYEEAAKNENIVAISIATRPDCIDENIANLLYEINKIKPVIIELGLQTSNESSAKYIRRGYDNNMFEKAVTIIDNINRRISDTEDNITNKHCNISSHIHIVVHMIIGLPGEDITTMLDTVRYINSFPIHGIKFQLLHILKNTDLAKDFEKKSFKVLSMEEYADILIKLLLNLRSDIVVHRITGDGPKKILIAPTWSADKKKVLNYINKRLKDHPGNQGLEVL